MKVEEYVLTGGVSLVAAFIGYLGASKTAKGSLEASINERMKIFLEENQKAHDLCLKRLGVVSGILSGVRGQLGQSFRICQELIALLQRNGIGVPANTSNGLDAMIKEHDNMPLLITFDDEQKD